jgi:Glycosyltransferase family 87/WD40-like Beta Propeller Repeat
LQNSIDSQVASRPLTSRWLPFFEWILFALLAAHMGLHSLPKAWRTLNTDFPNYYLTASLVREHSDTSRVYEWTWLQRQKDHRNIDQRVVGMVPITPFSTLIVSPLTALPALAAKHYWLIVNLGLLFATAFLLRTLTNLPWRRIGLVAALSFPLRINFLFGQYYVLLLFLLTLSCWLYIRQRQFLAGVAVGLAAGLKIFPIVYLLYFLRKKDLKAVAGGVLGALGSAAVSVVVFGWQLNRTYLQQVMPAVLRGEGLDPYNLQAASVASLLHRLFIFEPQLNPHPAWNAPWLFAVLHPLFQMAVVAPALLLAAPNETSPQRVRLEWAALLLASLAISTSPSSYLFTLLILPACLLLESIQHESRIWTAILLPLYAITGYLSGNNDRGEGWAALFAVPRLYAILLLCAFAYALLIKQQPRRRMRVNQPAWAAALAAVLIFNIASNLRHQQGLYVDYQHRIAAEKDTMMTVSPAVQNDSTLFIALLHDGYHSAIQRLGQTQFSVSSHDDQLAITASNSESWVEQTGKNQSTLVSSKPGRETIQQSESPVASHDGRWLAFLREDHGKAHLWLRTLDSPSQADTPITPPTLNVLETSFLPNGDLVLAADSESQPSLYVADQAGHIRPLGINHARYPSVSPDGRWLAYSELQNGNWNLRLHSLDNGQTRKLTDAACNAIQPAWAADSQTLLYASDWGRGLWFTALSQQRISR